jgi:hypothetical protein
MSGGREVEFVWREPGHATFDDAVDASRQAPRTRRGRCDSESLKAVSIVSYAIDALSVTLKLSDERTLRIAIEGDVISWELGTGESPTERRDAVIHHTELRLPRGETISWRPMELLDSRMHKTGVALAPTETLLYLYVKGCSDLMFCQMTDLATRERFLFWDED